MSTRSTIIEQLPDGRYRGIYCHNDGYVAGVGKILYEHYQDPVKVHALLDLGDLSGVGDTLEEVTAYHRDYNEEYTKPRTSAKIANIVKRIENNGFVYVYENNTWMVWLTYKDMYLPLDEAIELENPTPISEKLEPIPMPEPIPEPEKKEPTEGPIPEIPIEYKCVHCNEPIYPTWYQRADLFDRDWKHTDGYWGCGSGYSKHATAPSDAIWTAPSKKEDGAR